MNIMRKLVFLVVILGVIVLCVGCQSGLSEGRVRDIVEEEVARQLATVDKLTVSNLFIKNEDGKIVAMLGVIDGEAALGILDTDGENVVARLGNSGEQGALSLANEQGELSVIIGCTRDGGGLLTILNSGLLTILNADGELVAMISSGDDGNGVLIISDKYGQITFVAP